MAARRLVVVLIVLLLVSTVAAALAPGPEQEPPEQRDGPTARARPSPEPPAGRLRRETVDAAGERERIALRAGDQLVLRVRSRVADQVIVRGLGETEATDRYAPATLNLFATAPGSYAVRMLESRRTVATLVVRRARLNPEARSGRDRR